MAEMSAAEIGTRLHKAIDVALTLPHVVECKPAGQHFYEPIAAFNSRNVALAYGRDCAGANTANEYRVLEPGVEDGK